MNRDLLFTSNLSRKITNQHIIWCWISIIFNALGSLVSYLIIPEKKSFIVLGLSVSLLITIILGLKKSLRIPSKSLGVISIVLMNISFSYIYSQLNISDFQIFTFIYVGMFFGAGMFLLWELKYSILTLLITLIANYIFFKMFSPLSFKEIAINGGILTGSVSFFMIVSIQIRYKHLVNKVKSDIALLDSQENVKKSELKNRMLFNQNPRPMLIFLLDDLEIIDVNDTMVEAFGFSKSEFLMMKITDLRPAEEVGRIRKDVEIIKRGEEKKSEWKYVSKNGSPSYFEIDVKRIDYSGNDAGLILIQEITENKLVYQQLEDSEKELRSFFENNPTPMFVFEEENKKIIEVNKVMEEKYGYSKSYFKDIHYINQQLYRSFCEIVESENNHEKEYAHVLESGSFMIVTAQTSTIKYKRKNAKLVSLNDITSIKLNEMALEEATKLANEAKEHQSQFLSNMSHEIRTPMNGILGMTRLLQETELTKEQRKYMEAIFTSADNLMVIINEILDFSKIESGKLTIEKVPFNLSELSNMWEQTLKVKADEKAIGFYITKSADVPNNLIGDPTRLNQIIFNLMGNAIKFTEEGEVNLDILLKEKKEDEVLLQFDIKDTGIGIPSNKIRSIFSSFSQANSGITRKYGGTGLGLTITRQLIDFQEGSIWVESEVDSGSTFSFTLSYLIDKDGKFISSDQPLIETKIETSLTELNVLLVEDHDINQMLAIAVLEGWGCNVDLAVNGKEALDKVTIKDYDIVLMDIHMPVMDGYESTNKIRNNLKNRTPIIAMTASALMGDNQKCFDVGMNDYISKPFDPDLLLKKITNQIIKNEATWK